MSEEKQSLDKSGARKEGENIFAGFDFEALKVDIQEMFKAGVYFGHQKSRKNPKMDPYIFGVRNGINIIDLEKTAEKIKAAQEFVRKIVAEGQEILLVGTKKQVAKIVRDGAGISGMPYVAERWLGGTFTNFPSIAKRTKYLRDTREKQERGELSQYTKFEQMKIKEELDKLEEKMGGIKYMSKLPGAIFVTGINEDKLAIHEARKRGVPVIALADTNVNPEGIDFIIPANEDAVSSLRLMTAYIIQAILEGKKKISATVPASGK